MMLTRAFCVSGSGASVCSRQSLYAVYDLGIVFMQVVPVLRLFLGVDYRVDNIPRVPQDLYCISQGFFVQ